jgi:hypothetical protein
MTRKSRCDTLYLLLLAEIENDSALNSGQFRQECVAVAPGIAREVFHNGEKASGHVKKGGGEIFAPARSCIRKRRNDGRLTGAWTRGYDAAFALGALASQLANATNGFGLFTRTLLRGLFIVVAHLHFTKDAFALHLLLESAESLINVVVADKYLHENPVPSVVVSPASTGRQANRLRSRSPTGWQLARRIADRRGEVQPRLAAC